MLQQTATARKAQGLQWGVQDSNLRRLSHQIYSLTPLTTRETPLANPISRAFPTDLAAAPAAPPSPPSVVHPWSQRRDLNPQPADYKSAALPIELRWRNGLVENHLLYRTFRHVQDESKSPIPPRPC